MPRIFTSHPLPCADPQGATTTSHGRGRQLPGSRQRLQEHRRSRAVPWLLLSCCLPGHGHRFPSPAADSEALQPLSSAGLVAALWLCSHPRRRGTHGAVVQPSVPGQRPTAATNNSVLLPLGLMPPRCFASRRRGQDVPTDAFQEPLRTRSYFVMGKTFCGKAESMKKERF